MNGIVDALSKVANQSGPQLKWSQLYDNLVTFPDPPTGSDVFYTSQLGTYTAYDSLGHRPATLFTVLNSITSGVGLRTEFRIGAGDVGSPGSAADVDAVFTRTLAPNDMLGGKGNKVVLEQLKRTPAKWNTETPQCWAMIAYRGNATNPLPALCYQFTVKVPSNLSDILTHTDPATYTGWFEFAAWKDGKSNSTMYHRYGLVFEKKPGETGMRFALRFDLFRRDLSNNVISNDTPTALWRMESEEGTLEDGKQYTVYTYIDQKLDYTDLTGETEILIINDTDKTIAMRDSKTGVPTCGYANTPIARPIFHGIYTGGFPSTGTIKIEYGNTFIWDKPPIRISADPEPEILSRHILVDPIPGVGHEIYGVLASSQAQDIFRQAWETGGDMQPASAQAARTDTGYPVIESVTETTFASDSVNHAVAMPATVNAGDGLLVFLTIDGDSIPTTPAEWDKLYSEAYSTSVTGCAYALVATGTEGGTTVDFVTGSAEKGAAQVYRISNWNGTLGGFHNGIVAENGSGSTADLPAITAYWESAKTLWIGALHTSTSQTVSSAPTNYTDLTQTSSGAATTDGQCITARRFNETATEDPGVFTMSGTGAAKVYNTVAIAPAYVGPNYERFEVTRDETTLWQGLYTTQDHTVADSDITRAVIVVHGRSLDAAEYHNVVAHNMRDYLGNTIVLAPFYERNVERADVDQLFWGSSWPQLGRSSSLLPWRISSGEIMDLLVAHLYNTFENLEGVVIAGHSAGGQFCNRYSMASTDSRNRFIVSAPSSYAYPGVHRPDGNGGFRVPSSPSTYNDWKYGLDNLSSVSYANAIGASNLRRRFIYAKVHYMVGALDTNPASSSLDVTADAMVQGTQRVERQSYFYDYIRLVSVWR